MGAFAEILMARNIAVGVGTGGQVVLARPDSIVLQAPERADERLRLSSVLEELNVEVPDLLRRDRDADESLVFRVGLGGERPELIAGERRFSLRRASDVVERVRAASFEAELNHVVIGAQVVKGDPLGAGASWAGEMAFLGNVYEDPTTGAKSLLSTAEPAVAPPFLRLPLHIKPGEEAPRVLVLDTGLRTVESAAKSTGGATNRRPEHPLLERCAIHDGWVSDPVPGQVDDEDEPFDPPAAVSSVTAPVTNLLDFEAGHGTFIAGVILQICPDAQVIAAGVLSSFGDGDVAGVLSTLEKMSAAHGSFDLVVMSFGTNTVDDEPGIFGRELTRLLGATVGVAAAGNQNTCRPYFPAALPNVVGVGGLAADGRAWFSNYGGWVDACAPAVDVVSSFFSDFQEVLDGKDARHYEGWARWSGTSFSAPKVAALIAQEMYLNGGSAGEAWKRMISHKHFRYPDLGIVFNV